ncbi:MAG: DNA recombination protein RmuC [Bauldia sp.]
MNSQTFEIGGRIFSLGQIVAALAVAVFVFILLVLLIAWRRAARRAHEASDMEGRIAELVHAQSEMTGRMQSMAEVFGSRQSELMHGLTERIDNFGHRVNQSMTDTTRNTQESLGKLNERLAVIDKAQQNITSLSGQVIELKNILGNKQTRGAFGQARMEAIVEDGLPRGAYAFQHTLTNRNRPDCVISFPNNPLKLVIDAKFPLEAWNAVRVAEAPEALKAAEAQFRRDTSKHIEDIATRYFIPGETQDTAFLFVPSESIFADIHERFEDVVQRAHRSRVVIVSPSLLMLSIQVVMSLLRDARMREQAHVIQQEVAKMMEDVARLDERVRKLQTHFTQANTDIENIITSNRRIAARGNRISTLDFAEGNEQPAPALRPATSPAPRSVADELPELPFRGLGPG